MIRTMKRCPKCGETKHLDAFAKHRNRPDGHQSTCKPCKQEVDRRYHAQLLDDVKLGNLVDPPGSGPGFM
jgi:uncharacterized protein (DUF983 family)